MGDDYYGGNSVMKASIGTSSPCQLSQGGASVNTIRSKLSFAHHSLSPLYEEDASVEESPDNAVSPPCVKCHSSRERCSTVSSPSVSTAGQLQPTITEGSESNDELSSTCCRDNYLLWRDKVIVCYGGCILSRNTLSDFKVALT